MPAPVLSLLCAGSIPEDQPVGEDDNSSLPPFANAENRALDKGLKVSGRMWDEACHAGCYGIVGSPVLLLVSATGAGAEA